MLKSIPGTYVLILKSDVNTVTQIGQRGTLEVLSGYYVYIGSAFGPGGIAARVHRHCRKRKRKHWHIDYLRELTTPVMAWCCYKDVRLEHDWATAMMNMKHSEPIAGFGCTDCSCLAHLFHSSKKPDIETCLQYTCDNLEPNRLDDETRPE